MTTRRAFLAALPALAPMLGLGLLGGCGFHLRGTMDVPPELSPLYIKAPGGSAVKKAIEELLSGSQLALVTDPGQGQAHPADSV